MGKSFISSNFSLFHFMLDTYISGGVGCSQGGRSGPHLPAWGVLFRGRVASRYELRADCTDPPTRFAWRLLRLIKGNFTSSLQVWPLVAAYAQNLNNVATPPLPFPSAIQLTVFHSPSYSTRCIPILRTIYGVLDLE